MSSDASNSDSTTFRLRVLTEIDEVDRDKWNQLSNDGNPFVRHEFLTALERHGCVGDDTGWVPQHLALEDDQGELVAAQPGYLKYHSYGEFVFDWAWADALERAGMKYFPKLLCAIPFTPVTGPRLLAADGAKRHAAARALAECAIQGAQNAKLSSAHWLFNDEFSATVLDDLDLLHREGCQYHWENPGFRDFQDYLDAMSSKKRKQIRKERREAAAAPVDVEVLLGGEVGEAQWHAYHALYASTYDRKWGYPSLSAEFFCELGETMPDGIMLILARRGDKYVAGAHLHLGGGRLYGRNWGCAEHHRSLHFEICYYRGIEYCIEQGLTRFEAGAQGEHKLSRGFLPKKMHSYHWVAHEGFRDAIARFLDEERSHIDAHVQYMDEHSPFKEADPTIHFGGE